MQTGLALHCLFNLFK